MKEDEILEGNRLIAAFIGFKIRVEQTSGYPADPPEYDWAIDAPEWVSDYDLDRLYEHGGTIDEWYEILPFNKRWDWLMPVVEKISDVIYKGFSIVVTISGRGGVYIGVNDPNASGNRFDGKKEIANTLNCNYFNDYPGAEKVTAIEAAWMAVVQFIKWFSSQQH